MLRQTRDLLWRLVAIGAICLGGIGIVVPVLPTVPFLILAAFAASKGWPELERRLLDHPRYGPDIRGWREHGTIPTAQVQAKDELEKIKKNGAQ